MKYTSVCVNNHYAKFEYKRTKTVGVTDCTNQTPPMHFRWKICLNSTPVKNKKRLIYFAQTEGAHVHCVNNHYAKFENNEMKTIVVTDYTNQVSSKHFWTGKCLSSTPLQNGENIHEMCTKWKVHIFSMLTSIMLSLNKKE